MYSVLLLHVLSTGCCFCMLMEQHCSSPSREPSPDTLFAQTASTHTCAHTHTHTHTASTHTHSFYTHMASTYTHTQLLHTWLLHTDTWLLHTHGFCTHTRLLHTYTHTASTHTWLLHTHIHCVWPPPPWKGRVFHLSGCVCTYLYKTDVTDVDLIIFLKLY